MTLLAPQRRVLYAGGGLLLALLAFSLHPRSPEASRREIAVLVETASVSELMSDSAALRYLVENGVSGVVVKPSTISGIPGAREMAMASGAEILRLFRMEGIVNIWMWEQIRDKPIRPEATYIFTNQLIVFESVFETLQKQLGEANVRSYRDESHDFGGDIPGNYIIEVLSSVDDLRSVAIGIDRSYRDELLSHGLLPVVEISSPDEVEVLPTSIPAIWISSPAAARAAFEKLRPARVFLGRGITNPGWLTTLATSRFEGESATLQGGALVATKTGVLAAISAVKQNGFQIVSHGREGLGGEAKRVSGAGQGRRTLALLALFVATVLAILQAIGFKPPRPNLKHILAAAAIAAAASLAGERDAAVAIGALMVGAWTVRLYGSDGTRNLEEETWQGLGVITALFLAAEFIPLDRGAPSPFLFALLSLGAAAVSDARARRTNPYLVVAVALAAIRPPLDHFALIAAAAPLTLALTWKITDRPLRQTLVLCGYAASATTILNVTMPIWARLIPAVLLAAGAAWWTWRESEEIPGRL